MSSERKLFEAILGGVPIDQALAEAKQAAGNDHSDDIELF
jgi:hypothetical protein